MIHITRMKIRLNLIFNQERHHGKNRKKVFFKRWLHRFIMSTLVLLPVFNSCNTSNEVRITIATAANVQFAMDTLTTIFEKETGIKANIILGSSGKLTAQILQGAPYDVFVSANMKYPMEIYNNNLATGKPLVYAHGSLVLWSVKEAIDPGPVLLTDEKIRKIAIPNPKTAPYGEAAVELLQNTGIFEQVKNKLVYGETISQVNQFIISKTADIGFTSKSVVLSPEMRNTGSWAEMNPKEYTPIQQGVIIINRKNGHLEHAEKFVTFLLSATAKGILTEYGYKTDVSQ